MSVLHIVATPIGNLGDISARAVEVLGEVDVVFAEDTRVIRKILNHYGIKVPAKRYNEHSDNYFREAESFLKNGKNVALVSDAGTPGISDPGGKLVRFVRENMPEVSVVAVPGPSAITAALSISGLPANEFTFLGYPPAKRKRNKFFKKVAEVDVRPVVLYESPHRLQKAFEALIEIYGGKYEIFVAKELTKVYEEGFWGSLDEAKEYFSDKKGKGEFVVVVP